MLDSANETILQLKHAAAEAKEDAAEALDNLRHAEMRLDGMKPAEVESLRSLLFLHFPSYKLFRLQEFGECPPVSTQLPEKRSCCP